MTKQDRQNAMIKALKKSLCVIAPACKMIGINRSTHYRWMKGASKQDLAYQEAFYDILEESLDFAENSLLSQIKNGNTTATIFFLKTKGKERGYV